jgi:acyl-coenzyme A synthetase/AMP-(fatty) acid ligase
MTSATEKNILLERWKKTLDRRRTAAAILAPGGSVLRTFSDVENEALRWESALSGLPGRSVVALQIGNSPTWPALVVACFRRGLVPLPLGSQVEKSALESIFSVCGVQALIEGEGDELKLSQIANRKSQIEGTAFVKLTSGTTSAPRAIRFTAAQLVADCDNVCDSMGIRADDLNYGVIPFSHSYGFSNLVTPLLCRGVPLVAAEDKMPRAILDGLARAGATVFPGMPVFFQAFGSMENIPPLPRLRLCISAGAPLPAGMAARFTVKFGLKIHTFYGSSECGGICHDADDAPRYEEGFVGTPMRGVSIKLDAASRLEVRSAAVGLGYFPDDEPAMLGGGRFVPADLATETGRGIFLTGRVSDLINVAGRKLNPAEVEAVLMRFSGVRQAVVFGVPSRVRHEEPVACVVGEFDSAELLRFAQNNLGAWQVPRDYWFVDEIPVNERGKISRRELARRYLQRTS